MACTSYVLSKRTSIGQIAVTSGGKPGGCEDERCQESCAEGSERCVRTSREVCAHGLRQGARLHDTLLAGSPSWTCRAPGAWVVTRLRLEVVGTVRGEVNGRGWLLRDIGFRHESEPHHRRDAQPDDCGNGDVGPLLADSARSKMNRPPRANWMSTHGCTSSNHCWFAANSPKTVGSRKVRIPPPVCVTT